MSSNSENRVLVLSAEPTDADAVCATAAEAGILAEKCLTIEELCSGIVNGAGAAVIGQEVLSRASFDKLMATLSDQPAWSDFPVILIAFPTGGWRTVIEDILGPSADRGNFAVVQRPLNVEILVTALRTALRARSRQYELRRSQELLSESEARFRALVTASSEVLYRMSPDWSEMRQLSGGHFIADTEAPSRNWLQEYIPPDEQSRVIAVVNHAIRTKSIFELEHRVWRVDGSVGWTFSRAVPLLDAKGQIVEWFGAASDITERKQAEEALRESEARERARATELEAILDAVPALTFISRDPECQEMIGSRATYKLMRVRPGGNLTKTDPHRPEVAHFRPMRGEREIPVQDLPMQRAAALGESIRNSEFDLVFDDGSRRTLLGDAVPTSDENGRVSGVVAAFLDITERKRAEQRLRDSEQRYRALFESMREGFVLGEMVYDAGGQPLHWRCLDVNPAFESMFERKRHELVGRAYCESFPDVRWE